MAVCVGVCWTDYEHVISDDLKQLFELSKLLASRMFKQVFYQLIKVIGLLVQLIGVALTVATDSLTLACFFPGCSWNS